MKFDLLAVVVVDELLHLAVHLVNITNRLIGRNDRDAFVHVIAGRHPHIMADILRPAAEPLTGTPRKLREATLPRARPRVRKLGGLLLGYTASTASVSRLSLKIDRNLHPLRLKILANIIQLRPKIVNVSIEIDLDVHRPVPPVVNHFGQSLKLRVDIHADPDGPVLEFIHEPLDVTSRRLLVHLDSRADLQPAILVVRHVPLDAAQFILQLADRRPAETFGVRVNLDAGAADNYRQSRSPTILLVAREGRA